MPLLPRSKTHDYELLPRADFHLDDLPQRDRRDSNSSDASSKSWYDRLGLPGVNKLTDPAVCARYITPRRRKRSALRLIYCTAFAIPYVLLLLVLVAAIAFPSYTHLPQHYNELRKRALASDSPGRANVHDQKVFIAAAIYEEKGALTQGAWGKSVLELVDLLGPQNVHLSIYENDADEVTKQSLRKLEKNAPCELTCALHNLFQN